MLQALYRRVIFPFLLLIVSIGGLRAQNSRRELSLSFSPNGNLPFAYYGTAGYYKNPFIWDFKCQIATNYVQSLSLGFEHISETRSHSGTWGSGGNPFYPGTDFPVEYNEVLSMNVLYFELAKTFIRFDDLRFIAALSIGYGAGLPSATITRTDDHSNKDYDAEGIWTSFFFSGSIRARYTFLRSDNLEFGLTATARYWGLPSLGPASDEREANRYYGPDMRTLHELGYLVGISVGIN